MAPGEDSTASPTASNAAVRVSEENSPKSPNSQVNGENDPEPKSSGKKGNTASNGKKPAPGTASSLNKTYGQLIQEAIVALKDRTGSSMPAISKWILCNYPELQDGPHFRRTLNAALRTGVKKDHFTKVRCSFKLSPAFKAKEAAKKKKIALAKKKKREESVNNVDKVVESNAKKVKQLEKQDLSPEELDKMKADLAKKEELARKKAEIEAKARLRAERLRRRKYPMEDTKLHAEDKELGVKQPADVTARPYLPYFWHATKPPDHPARSGKTQSSVLQASKVDGLDVGSPGLVPDLLVVYNFFRGDVHFTCPKQEEFHSMVPEFTLQNLIFAVEQIINGNARKSKLIPPLITHLFVTSLQLLILKSDESSALDKNVRKLRRELRQYLGKAISPTSWGEICGLYMDAMDRFYTTDASRDSTVLPALSVDLEYLLGIRDNAVVPMTPGKNVDTTLWDDKTDGSHLPERYFGYFGDPRGVLYRAHDKLSRQDPWMLTAEELMALLRALTDDILASNPVIADDVAAREEEMQELLRAKRSADIKFRKVRLAFEGPKKPSKAVIKPEEVGGESIANSKVKGAIEDDIAAEAKETNEAPFKPTATKKQFEAAKRMQQKASEAYEKGIRKLVARTEPVGFDRNFNAVYCFRHDPEFLYIEELRPQQGNGALLPKELQCERRSWHVIDSTSLFDQFVSSLDIRGKREHDLYEELMGPQGAQQSLRRFLQHDDLKSKELLEARNKQREHLEKKLEAARVKCDEEAGRRSGRLAGQAGVELSQIEQELRELDESASSEEIVKHGPLPDDEELTGLSALKRFETAGQKDQRRTREVKQTKARYVEVLNCSSTVSTGNVDGTGMMGMIAAKLFAIEELCESLHPHTTGDSSRSQWISKVENAVHAWNTIQSNILGPSEMNTSVDDPTDENASSYQRSDSLERTVDGSPKKRRRVDVSQSPSSLSSHSVSSILPLLKQPLLELEGRAAMLTNTALADRDAQLADDNMSNSGDENTDAAEKMKLEKAWKRLIYRIQETPSKKASQIRDLLVSAISAARKAHLPQVMQKLRTALLLYQPDAAGDCKTAAVKVLKDEGGYDAHEDDDMDEGDPEDETADLVDEDANIPSVISHEAALLNGLSDDASRADWIETVKSAKTISRLAALVTAFGEQSREKLSKLVEERDALLGAIKQWQKEEDRNTKKKPKGRASSPYQGPSEVWAEVEFTDEVCMAKVESYPWWPARKCTAKEPHLAESLAKLDRSLVALVGEMGSLRVIKNDMIKPFTGKVIPQDEEKITRDMRSQLTDCIAIGRRLLRGIDKARENAK